MDVQIIDVKNRGELEQERVILRVTDNDNMGHYLMLGTTCWGDILSNEVQHPFWMPNKVVRKGDLVVIHTKSGVSRSIAMANGSDKHFFYRCLDKPIWNNNINYAILMDIREWAMKPIMLNK